MTKKEIKETLEKIGLLNEIDSKDNIRVMTNYQIKILELEDLLNAQNILMQILYLQMIKRLKVIVLILFLILLG